MKHARRSKQKQRPQAKCGFCGSSREVDRVIWHWSRPWAHVQYVCGMCWRASCRNDKTWRPKGWE